MKLRASNQQKHFVTEKVPDLDLSSADGSGDEATVHENNDDVSDEDAFVEDENAAGRDEDEDASGAELEELDPDSDDYAEERSVGSKAIARGSRSTRDLATANPKDAEIKGPGHVESYPTASAVKWTRSYVGPLAKWARIRDLTRIWFGDLDGYGDIIYEFCVVWGLSDVLPPKLINHRQLTIARNPWVSEDVLNRAQSKFSSWFTHYMKSCQQPQISVPLSSAIAMQSYIPQITTELTAHLGPFDDQKPYNFSQGKCIPLCADANPMGSVHPQDDKCAGWLFDVGGIALSLAWAPIQDKIDQLIAISVIPYSDQEFYEKPEEKPLDAALQHGSVQIWRIKVGKDNAGGATLTLRKPAMVAALCFEWGRAVRLQWCPVPLSVHDHIGLLAVLTSGKVGVIAVRQPPEGDKTRLEDIQKPVATLELPGEFKVEITCFAWINTNRIVVGHTDGSIAVWSVYPCRMLQRHPVHATHVLDIASGFPSNPFLVSSVPTGGVSVLTDLNRPMSQMAYTYNMLVNFQPNLLSWCEHMRGFLSLAPTNHPGNNTISFHGARIYTNGRYIVGVEGQPTCLAVGVCQPYLLVGSSDGSVIITNVFRQASQPRRVVPKLKLFQHEYRAPPQSAPVIGSVAGDGQQISRGICRILHNFKPQANLHPKHERGIEIGKRLEKQKQLKGKSATHAAKKLGKAKGERDEGEAPNKSQLGLKIASSQAKNADISIKEMVVYEPLSRITAVAWNPNVYFSWWAAAAMGSGLVRIMDLGVEMHVDDQPQTQEEERGDIGEDEQDDLEMWNEDSGNDGMVSD